MSLRLSPFVTARFAARTWDGRLGFDDEPFFLHEPHTCWCHIVDDSGLPCLSASVLCEHSAAQAPIDEFWARWVLKRET
jgi:hypothetical protein